jgi:hypothetical protein
MSIPSIITPPYVENIFPQTPGIPVDLTGPCDWNHPLAERLEILDHHHAIIRPVSGKLRGGVCIVGYAENSRHLAEYNNPDCEIWGVNQVTRFIPREDRHFQIHHNWDDQAHWAANTDQRKWLEHAPVPIYMISHDPSIPNSVAYPIDRVKENLNLTGKDYFTSSIAFMIALAIAEGFKRIGIYGIDLIIGREYQFEKACVEFYLGIANERGIDIFLPANSALLWQSHRYGYDIEPDYGFFGMSALAKRRDTLRKEAERLRDTVYTCHGMVNEAERNESLAGSTGEAARRTETLRKELDQALNANFMVQGALEEISRMYDMLEMKSRGGEVRA